MPLTLALVTAAVAACPATVASVDAASVRALAAYEALDLVAFGAARDALRADVACLTEIASPTVAARVHLVEGLGAWVDRDATGARSAFRSARIDDPTLALSETAAPQGSRVRAIWQTADTEGPGPGERPPPGRWAVDGRFAGDLPRERAAMVQRLDPTGRVGSTWYFAHGVERASLPDPGRARVRAGIVTAGAGALALAGAFALREVYVAAPEGQPMEGLYVANLSMGVAGLLSVGAGAGLVVAGAVTW